MSEHRKYSRKRLAILEALRSTNSHPTAEWLYQSLKPAYPDLSLGTVYRNLARFREEKLIISVGVVNGQEHFDAVTEPHAHFICRHCGAIIDLDLEAPGMPEQVSLGNRQDLHVESVELVLRGMCVECQKARASTPARLPARA